MKKSLVAFFPSSERPDAMPGVETLDVDAFVARYAEESAPLMWIGVVLGAVVFTVTPVFTVYRPLPSFWLSRELLDRHTDRLASHPVYLLRQMVFLLKMVGGICWGQHPLVRERLALAPYPEDPPRWRTS